MKSLTAADLIAILQTMPQDAIVEVNDDEGSSLELTAEGIRLFDFTKSVLPNNHPYLGKKILSLDPGHEYRQI